MHQKGVACWLSRLHKVTAMLDVDLGNTHVNKIVSSLFNYIHAKMLNEINDSSLNPKLRTYKTFKMDIRLEPYLNYSMPKAIYSNIARFRLSSHNLNIELGRHKRPFVTAEHRICEKCNLNEVEDEFHCLMKCEKWNDIRVNLFNTARNSVEGLLILDQYEQFVQILTSKDTNLNFALGKFLQIAPKVDSAS